jgi:hypothetical protein
MKTLTRHVFTGIPHHNEDLIGLRPIVWRIILGALPNKTKDWQSSLENNYKTYEDFKKELIVKPKLKDEEARI